MLCAAHNNFLCFVGLFYSILLHICNNSRMLCSNKFITMMVLRVHRSLGQSSFHFTPNDWKNLQKTLKLSTLTSISTFIQSVKTVEHDQCTWFSKLLTYHVYIVHLVSMNMAVFLFSLVFLWYSSVFCCMMFCCMMF